MVSTYSCLLNKDQAGFFFCKKDLAIIPCFFFVLLFFFFFCLFFVVVFFFFFFCFFFNPGYNILYKFTEDEESFLMDFCNELKS